MNGFTDRQQLLAKMRNGESLDWDIIVVGGGITGAGVLREARRRGYRVLLLEQQDFSWGTSSRSSKMVHGGLRYLAAGDVKLTRESVVERERLLAEAPGLVDRIAFYFTFRKGLFPGRFAMTVILAIYDFLASIKDHRYCNNEQLLKRFPGLDKTNLKGASYYTDAMVDDSRLVMRVLQDSIDDGAHALNYTKVTNLLLENNKVCGVAIEDVENASAIELRASVVINATGAWADRLRNEVNSEKRIRPLRGSHIIIPKSLYPVSDVMTFLHQDDKRGVYVYPWEGTTVLGTTDLDHAEDLDVEASISNQETDYLLNAFNRQFPHNQLTRADVLSTWAGVRPVISAERGKNPSKERRDHAVWSDNGLITVSGGKLTTFRLIALDAINAAADSLPKPTVVIDDTIFVTPDISAGDLLPNNPQWAQRLLGRYGKKAPKLLEESGANEHISLGETEFCLAECRWAVKYEAVKHLDDLLLRRTRLGMCLPNGGDALYPALKDIFSTERNWDNDRWEEELSRYKAIWNSYYSLPDNP
ncbi:MAG TPA: glycerol-3-phosphate dehydrogenase/oxidase [Porticoccaceae bacterium]|nr:glycerol-3-phosphate dehydrogenase/oxidase [Porticoccaceae bacterium]